MRSVRIIVGLVFCVSFAAACPDSESGGAEVPPAVASACEAVGACGGSEEQMECETAFVLVSAPAGCLDAVETAPCEEHAADSPSYTDTCFPSCNSEGEHTCNGDGTLTVCGDVSGELRAITLNCTAVCESKGYPFTGTCGPEYNGHTTPKGIVCWCDADGEAVGYGQ